MKGTQQNHHIFETASGFCAIIWGEGGIRRFHLPMKTVEAAERLLARRASGATPDDPPREIAVAIAEAKRHFKGERTDFTSVPLDLDEANAFFTRIYEALRLVGWGCTTTYGALAKAVGAPPEAARDVGEAMARNPAPLIIPCHRVLAVGGKIGGFSAPGGSQTKLRMLALEGVRLAPPPAVQPSFDF